MGSEEASLSRFQSIQGNAMHLCWFPAAHIEVPQQQNILCRLVSAAQWQADATLVPGHRGAMSGLEEWCDDTGPGFREEDRVKAGIILQDEGIGQPSL